MQTDLLDVRTGRSERPATPRYEVLTSSPTKPLTRRRRKRRLDWEQAELSAHAEYAQTLRRLKSGHPELTLMECRVCALTKESLPNWKIAERLSISEKTVENHLRSARVKLGLPPGTRIHRVL